jgi:phosphate transport system substrate-binding protein
MSAADVRCGVRRAVLLAVTLLVAGCASWPWSASRELRVAGSDTELPLAQRWAASFMLRNPGTLVHVEGGGTATGIRALVEGRVELATGSRSLLPEEVRELAARYGTVGISIRCARDGLSVYLNPANPVRDIGLPSLKAIFSGRLGSWHKLGGPEAPIHVVIRPPSSGTRRLFRDLVLHEEPFSDRATVLATTEDVVAAVREDPHAIGFGGIAFGTDLVHCSIDGEPPTPENVLSGAYPLSRYLYLHAVRPPRGLARRFVDFVLEAEGQGIVEDAGFVPLF